MITPEVEVKKDTTGVDEALDAGMAEDPRNKAIEAIKNMVTDPNSNFNQTYEKFAALTLHRAKAEAAIDEMVADPNSAFNQKRAAMGNMEAGASTEAQATMSIEDQVAMAKEYVAQIEADLAKAKADAGGESVMADAVAGVEIQKVKDMVNNGLDAMIAEIRPTAENPDPLVSSKAGVLINDLEALKM